jgi:hypothetical protein
MNRLGAMALLLMSAPALAGDWFYGHPAPTIPPDVAYKAWYDCIVGAGSRLDDRISSVMDIASAIQPLCVEKETTVNDAINNDFLDKNPGISANMSLTEMVRVRQEAHASYRQQIGTLILGLRKNRKSR